MFSQDWLSLAFVLSTSINSIVKLICLAFRLWLIKRYGEGF